MFRRKKSAIFLLILFELVHRCYSQCLSCQSIFYRTCSSCLNEFPQDRSHIEQISIRCTNPNQTIFQSHERFYSIAQSYSTENCTMKIFYLDQFTLWNYLQSLSITYAQLTRLSPVIFNRSLSFRPILYSIKTLNFSHNSLRILQQNFSFYFPSLEKLDLSYNRLKFIRKHALQNFIYLKELHLNHNQLKQLSLTFFPRQSIRLINLDSNPWFCSCANVLTLALSRPIPHCQAPAQYRNQNVGHLARQCFLRTKATIFLTINQTNSNNFTCALSSTVDIWKNKIQQNLTLLSAWHIEQHRSIAIEYLYALSKTSEKYLICFNPNSSQISMIIPLNSPNQTMNSTTINRPVFILKPSNRFSSFLISILHASQNLLPKSFRTSEKQILLLWFLLFLFALMIVSVLIYFIYLQYRKQAPYELHSSPDYRTIFNFKFHCKNHKCLCQYRRNTHSSIYLSRSKSIILSNLDLNASANQPLLIKPVEFRYAKIKRLSSARDLSTENNFLTGQFRTIVKFRTSPD